MSVETNRSSRLQRRDLLIGLTCTVILACLSIPFLLNIREAFRRTHCANQLQGIVLAAHEYHDLHQRLPSASLGHAGAVDFAAWSNDSSSNIYWKTTQNTSYALAILPFMRDLDSGDVSRQFIQRFYDNQIAEIATNSKQNLTDYNAENPESVIEWQADIPGLMQLATQQLPGFRCPADLSIADGQVAIIATQPCRQNELAKVSGFDLFQDIAIKSWTRTEQLGLTNYLGCLGAVGGQAYEDSGQRWAGSMSMRVEVELELISDGTSRTIMLGESIGQVRNGNRTAAMSWIWGGGARSCGDLTIDDGVHPNDPSIRMLGDSDYSSAVGFGSFHRSGVNIGLCDGSVRNVSRDVHGHVLYELGGMSDGAMQL